MHNKTELCETSYLQSRRVKQGVKWFPVKLCIGDALQKITR